MENLFCEICGGTLNKLGILGNREHYNCQQCGMESSYDLSQEEYSCIDCGEQGLTFDGADAEKIYEPGEETGEKRCWACDRKANPEKYENI